MLAFILLGSPVLWVHWLVQSTLNSILRTPNPQAQHGAAFLGFQLSCPLEVASSFPSWSCLTFLKESVLFLPVLKNKHETYGKRKYW